MNTRREFLALLAGAAALPSRVAFAAGQGGRAHLLQMNAFPLDVETPLDLLTTYLTPNELFFVRSHWNSAPVDQANWTLTIDGEVGQPLTLTLQDLKMLPKVDATCVLQCSGNGRNWFEPAVPGVQWRYGAVGNARWSGARMSDILTRAGINRSARHLRTFGGSPPPGRVPPFNRSIEIDKAMEDVVVAYEMNGEPLPHNHGGPARLVVPGWAGDHWMKWLRRVTVSSDPQTGFYMDTAYRLPVRSEQDAHAARSEPIRQLLVKSNITTAPTHARVGVAAAIRGFAFSGAPDISRVQITDDGGATWHDAALHPEHAPHAWRLWSYEWQPSKPGAHTLAVRATDSVGEQQPKNGNWNPGGYLYNGWHSVSVEVQA